MMVPDSLLNLNMVEGTSNGPQRILVTVQAPQLYQYNTGLCFMFLVFIIWFSFI